MADCKSYADKYDHAGPTFTPNNMVHTYDPHPPVTGCCSAACSSTSNNSCVNNKPSLSEALAAESHYDKGRMGAEGC
jgi:hypothetical protein